MKGPMLELYHDATMSVTMPLEKNAEFIVPEAKEAKKNQ